MTIKPFTVGQLGWIILFCRLFSLLTFSPGANAVNGSIALLAIPIGALFTLGILWIITALLGWLGYDSADEAFEKMPKTIRVVFFAIVWAYIILSVAMTGADFNSFLETTVFAQSSIFLYTVLFLLCCGYCAICKEGALGGLALLNGLFLMVSLATVSLAVAPQINLYEVTSPFSSGLQPLFWTAFRWFATFGDLILLILLAGHDRSSMFKSGAFGIIGAAIVYVVFSFLTLTVLGDYTLGVSYPVYQLARFAGFGFMSRMDLIHIVLWVFTAVLRASAFLFAMTKFLSLQNKKGQISLFLSYGICCGLSLYFSYRFTVLYQVKTGLWPTILVTLLIIPCLFFAGKNTHQATSSQNTKTQ